MSGTDVAQPDEVLDFWFEEVDPACWWKKSPEFDARIRRRFGATHAAAACAQLYTWRDSSAGRLAEIIVLDQFSRNIYRDRAEAFACDPIALALAQTAVADGADAELVPAQRNFLYMPYMHSESLEIHDVAMTLFERNGDTGILEFERRHRAIIERFGRYPHRNRILGRESTPEERAFLAEPGSSF